MRPRLQADKEEVLACLQRKASHRLAEIRTKIQNTRQIQLVRPELDRVCLLVEQNTRLIQPQVPIWIQIWTKVLTWLRIPPPNSNNIVPTRPVYPPMANLTTIMQW